MPSLCLLPPKAPRLAEALVEARPADDVLEEEACPPRKERKADWSISQENDYAVDCK